LIRGDYAVTSLKNISLLAKDQLSATTISGIMSYISGSKLNMKSVNTMTIKSELLGIGSSLTFSGIGSSISASGIGSTVTAKNGLGVAIELTGHIHPQPNDADGDVQLPTLAPIA